MKRILFALLFILITLAAFAQTYNIKVMTYNIRCGYCEDISNVNHWGKRKYLVAYMIKAHNPDLIGLQEAEIFQVNDLLEMLDDYDYYGLGREDGKEKGESAAIFYKKDKFKLEQQITRWLSETPEIVSKGWDAALNRTITIVKLKEIKSEKEFYFLNTHFDHIGEVARTESSRLIINQIEEYSKTYPVILTGDFNYTSNSDGFKIITSKLFDSKLISKTASVGGNITFNGFGKSIEQDNKIDFIFVNDKTEVLNDMIDTTTFNGLYPSDHYPVIAEILLR